MLISRSFTIVVILIVALCSSAHGQSDGYDDKGGQPLTSALASTSRCLTTHRGNKLGMTVSNLGIFGKEYNGYISFGRSTDCFTGNSVASCQIPTGVNNSYLFGGALWIGAIVGRDTLVTTGFDGWGIYPKHDRTIANGGYLYRNMEFHPDPSPEGDLIRRTNLNPLSPEVDLAVSEEDVIAVFNDTTMSTRTYFFYDDFDMQPHRPMGLVITQSSYAWSFSYAEDFILVNYEIKNAGDSSLRQVHMGLLMDGDIWGDGNRDRGRGDDITGFRRTRQYEINDCEFEDTINLAWIADNDGDYWTRNPVPGVLGTRFLRAPESSHLNVSYNWWTSNNYPALDFGPRRKHSAEHPFRDLRTGGLGTPEGDLNKYNFLSNGEIDYDQIYMLQISPLDTTWLYPNQNLAKFIPRGYDVSYLQSVGPFNIDPGEILTVTLAFVADENFHTYSRNYMYHLQTGTYEPDEYMAGLNWKDYEQNAAWAGWVYDNPGVDTDGDGYFGKFHLCCGDSTIESIDIIDGRLDTTWLYDACDTIWYEGDRSPDFRGATPPPAPKVWVEPSVGELKVRWNGFRSETTPDVFTRRIDFDGYHVYMSRDRRESSYVLMASYDRENYVQYVYDWATNQFELKDDPFSRQELACLYGQNCNDSSFNPLDYKISAPLIWGDSLIYFAPQDFNRSELGLTTPITKVYPDAPIPPYKNPTLVPEDERDIYVTADGYFKYYEYQHIITNLLPTISYFVNVTAFDYGSPKAGLGTLESSVSTDPVEAFPNNSAANVAANDLNVYTYPNPYRIDSDYLDKGYEGRDARYYIPERMRRIHFANLPAKCTIGIYSLDGDLIREFEHDEDPSDPTASEDAWDMITRNTQAVVTGIYYWVVAEPNGRTQIGKFVIMK